MGTRKNHLAEAVLTCTHNVCFKKDFRNIKNLPMKFLIFTAEKKNPVYCMSKISISAGSIQCRKASVPSPAT